jgi:hypothetical protein
MKKIFTLLVLGLFLISLIPATFAERGEGMEQSDKRIQAIDVTGQHKTKADVMAMNSEDVRASLQEKLKDAIQKCEDGEEPEVCKENLRERIRLMNRLGERALERLRIVEARRVQKLNELEEMGKNPNLLKYKEKFGFKAREIVEARLSKAKQDYKEAKEKYDGAREDYLDAQNKFKDAKEKLEDCEEGTEDCNQLKEEIKVKSKEYLLKTADNILKHLNKIKANVEANEDLSEEEAAEIIGKIDEMITEIESAKSTIESSEDKEEIIEAAKTLKNAWSGVRKRLTVHSGRIVNSRIGGIVVRVKQLEVKLERILARMEENEIDTTEIQSLIDEFNVKTSDAKSNYESALEKFNEASDADGVTAKHELGSAGHELMKKAHSALQEAQKLLRDIILTIKQKEGGEEMNAPEDAAEEEADEEDDDDNGGGDDEGEDDEND